MLKTKPILSLKLYSKDRLRKDFSSLRDNLSDERRKEASLEAKNSLLSRIDPTHAVLSFASFKSEIDLWPLNLELIKTKNLILPKIEGSTLGFYQVTNLEHLIPSGYNILEPDPKFCSPVDIRNIDVILVPGLCFDADFRRLGYGKGHYDRIISLIKAHSLTPFIWGIGFQEQFFSRSLPQEDHDQPLDRIFLF